MARVRTDRKGYTFYLAVPVGFWAGVFGNVYGGLAIGVLAGVAAALLTAWLVWNYTDWDVKLPDGTYVKQSELRRHPRIYHRAQAKYLREMYKLHPDPHYKEMADKLERDES